MPNWVDGQRKDELATADRGLNLGDGHFSTLRVSGGRILAWPLHRQRLQHACQRLSMGQPDWDSLQRTLDQALAHCDPSEAVIKVVITRGCQGRGYDPLLDRPPTVIVSTFDYPQHYLEWQRQGVTLDTARLRLGTQPALAAMKTLGRLEQVLLRRELKLHNADDLLVLDSDNRIIEASAANLFLIQGSTLITPSLARCGVAGVMRHQLLRSAADHGWTLQVRDVVGADLDRCDGAFITNALMGAVPVIGIDGRPLPIPHSFSDIQRLLLC
ncbi:aminodeoxychorismate lyase apoprotein [Ferrimonas sediminum]|uniref:Aminodeoxychorismate lyase n=1 Tax=Ferrimonas sediminum TaxID=718193 RepID=A0A1G8VYW3_9GAMM|nr:aminodeoxychorismate lyase [Ferrimonas sediminum]SDJ71291.1 aminodeoxychorismate lyase apoprotein [Ferrimonas sediminum]